LAQLAKQHSYELSPTREAASVALGVVLLYGRLELQSREKLQQLRENAGYSIQGGSLLSWLILVLPNPKST